KEKEQAEGKSRNLPLREEIRSQKQRNQPLQQRSSPKTKRRAKPSTQIVAAFMDYEVRAIDKEKLSMRRERIEEKRGVENQPRNQCCTRNGLPRFPENRLEIVQHSATKIIVRTNTQKGRLRTCGSVAVDGDSCYSVRS